MNTGYIVGGIAFLAYGIYLTIKELKIFKAGEQNKFGWDIKGLGAGICCIMVGIYLLCKISLNPHYWRTRGYSRILDQAIP